jgi:hypothetical protein
VANPAPAAPVADTSKTFEDVDGNGIDDDCQTGEVVADPEAAASAQAAVDADGNGTISVSEAAQSEWTGGTNCNHGGYVSGVAQAQCGVSDSSADTSATGSDEDADEGSEAEAETGDSATGAEGGDETESDATDATDATETADCTDEPTTAEDAPVECVTAPTEPADEPATVEETAPQELAPNAHGKAVAEVAQSDAVGGKNCNHGGAVSEAAKKDHEAAREARDAAKAARKANHAEHHAKPHADRGGRESDDNEHDEGGD